MILERLTLQQFRSYSKRIFEFVPGITLIVAPNAAGKTNILESIFFLATGKSFRADVDRESIRFGQEIARIQATVGETKLELVQTVGEVGGKKTPLKKCIVNGIPRRQIDFVGHVRAVLFWPEQLELVTDSPSLRRRYLDSVLVQVDREYRRNLLSYERGLRQRNRLLDLINEGKASRSQLLFWNQLLISAGTYITQRRAAYIDFVNEYQVSSVKYRIEYDKSVISEARLDQYKDEEVAAKATLVGPHRDDMIFTMKNEKLKMQNEDAFIELSKYGSRGQQRLGVLWLKLAEVSFIEQQTGDRPMLLLDDIFSELDEPHKALVMDVIDKQQTIITSADSRQLSESIQTKASVIEL
jgi:DNA replication and repair protein RecF